jgi:hypothetical protein
MEHVVRELEVEEGRFVFFELRRGWQYVIGQPRRLGHEHVDNDDEIERRHGLAHPLTVGERVRGIAGLNE